MSQSNLDQVAVLGAGVLGSQIAWHSAYRGKSVVIYDLYDDGLRNCRNAHQTYAAIYRQDLDASQDIIDATVARISYTTNLGESVAVADLVIEAAPEVPDTKVALYRQLAPHLQAHTLVVTNSSTLLPSQFAESTGRPGKFCSLHFANLIWSLNLAEVMAHPGTENSTLLAVTQFAIEIGMVPIPIEKEQSGYVLNSWFVPLLQSAQTLVTNGVSTPEYIDRTYMIGNRGCSFGPCGLMDIVGMKTVYDILQHWGTVNKDEQMLINADYIKHNFLDRGLLGLQSGQGYYTYPNPSFQAADFLDVPDIASAPEIAHLAEAK
ncbi:MAG: 3-hydroxyacyl-CoA dehydrogenase [Halieaceae bacterium]|jgi:3-hydroxyacyl-CoA dehydrogenase|nr:3-hydroxyacyl-CoA dehydrogenase [Halieaceae bacterium]